MLNAAVGSRGLPHVIVVGNEEGGSGKTTIAMHIAVALMKSGQRLATIDLDSRQRTLTHYMENRRAWARRCHVDLELPTHLIIANAEGTGVDEKEASEFADFGKAVAAIEHRHDFVVIDTPPHDSSLMRLAHSVTDTLVTPLNDSFLDLDVLAKIDPVTFAVTGVSHYAELVREMRRHRRSVDGDLTDWVVVRNRISPGSSTKPVLCDCKNWRSRWAFGSRPASMNVRSIAIFSRAGSPRWIPFATLCPPPIRSVPFDSAADRRSRPAPCGRPRRVVRCANSAVGYWRYPGRTTSLKP